MLLKVRNWKEDWEAFPFDAIMVNRKGIALVTGGEFLPDKVNADRYGRQRMIDLLSKNSIKRLILSLDEIGTSLYRTHTEEQDREGYERFFYKNSINRQNSINYTVRRLIFGII